MPHTKRLEMRTLAEQHPVKCELTERRLVLNPATTETEEAILFIYTSPHHRKQYELGVNESDLTKRHNLLCDLRNVTSAEFNRKIFPLKRVYELYPQ